MIRRKGLHDLLTALAPLRDRDWHLDVVGSLERDPDYVADIRRRARTLDLAERLTLHGTFGGSLLTEKYAKCQLLVVPSSYEGFGIVYLEAMSFGLPVIANTAGATDEIVRHESTGFLVQPGDTVSLGRQIERVMDDPDLLARMSLASLEAFRDHPTWKTPWRRFQGSWPTSPEPSKAFIPTATPKVPRTTSRARTTRLKLMPSAGAKPSPRPP